MPNDHITNSAPKQDHITKAKINHGAKLFKSFALDEIPKPPPLKWAVERIIPAGLGTLFFAPPDCGKSITALQLALCVATHQPFLDLQTDPSFTRVEYIDFELNESLFKMRAEMVAGAMGLAKLPHNINYVKAGDAFANFVDAWAYFQQPNESTLTIIDSVGIAACDIDFVKNPSAVIQWMKMVEKKAGTWLGLCHKGKGPQARGPFGSQFFEALARSSVEFIRKKDDSNEIQLKQDKHTFTSGKSIWSADVLIEGDETKLLVTLAAKGPFDKKHTFKGYKAPIYDLICQSSPDGITNAEIAQSLGLDIAQVKPRTSELKKDKFIFVVAKIEGEEMFRSTPF